MTAPPYPKGLSGGPRYGWVLVIALGVTEMVSYGVLSYAFPVFLSPMESELGWSRTALTGAYSLAALVAGVAAVPVGVWLDRDGARAVMTCGSILAMFGVLAWARVSDLSAFYAVWVLIGIASAAVLYEPAFAVVAQWFEKKRSTAFTLLTFIAGFASVLFVPFANWLVEQIGWRSALVVLGGILGAVTVPIHAILLRKQPSDRVPPPDGARAAVGSPEALVRERRRSDIPIRSRAFSLITLAFTASTLTSTAIAIHLIPLLLERGFESGFASAAVGLLGLTALPGRLVFTPLGDVFPRRMVTAALFGLQALGLAVLYLWQEAAAVWIFVVLFGAGFGAITPARAALVAETFGSRRYGKISGVMSPFFALARAGAPVGASILHTTTAGYAGVLLVLFVLSAVGGISVLINDQGGPRLHSPGGSGPSHSRVLDRTIID